MSGHSKWATTKRRKAVVDAKRSSLFTKLANAISVAARAGNDTDSNFKLRMAIDKAKSFSLPKDNIEKAVKRGADKLDGSQLEELIYEGYGPEKIALIMEVVTDNKNRTSQEIKHLLTKYGGTLAGPGSVKWQFEYQGVITLDKQSLTDEEELAIIDAGAEDIKNKDGITIYTKVERLEEVKKKIEKLNLPILDAGLEYIAKNLVKPKNENSLLKLFEALDKVDDISNFYSNADI
ncbi:YebC/PmpR family DNA-binding transcriptional regulator [Patescibacteria group bacterium]|nr:YebC/PmpR family DNA-binding transcriptional regulator [Patescibacteria group bacterium]